MNHVMSILSTEHVMLQYEDSPPADDNQARPGPNTLDGPPPNPPKNPKPPKKPSSKQASAPESPSCSYDDDHAEDEEAATTLPSATNQFEPPDPSKPPKNPKGPKSKPPKNPPPVWREEESAHASTCRCDGRNAEDDETATGPPCDGNLTADLDAYPKGPKPPKPPKSPKNPPPKKGGGRRVAGCEHGL